MNSLLFWLKLPQTWPQNCGTHPLTGGKYAQYSSNDSTIAVTVSIGIVQCQSDDMTPTAVFARADNALYKAKQAGRNNIAIINPCLSTALLLAQVGFHQRIEYPPRPPIGRNQQPFALIGIRYHSRFLL